MNEFIFWQGDPRKTRMRVQKSGIHWRVFELTQFEVCQFSSAHPDITVETWQEALNWGHRTALRDRLNARDFGPDRRFWPSARKRRALTWRQPGTTDL